MSTVESFPFNTDPAISFIDRSLGTHRLDREIVRPYYEEALELTSGICGHIIETYRSGPHTYTRAISKTVSYQSGENTTSIALAITVGPASSFDTRVVEEVEIGVFSDSPSSKPYFLPLAKLRDGLVRAGNMASPRMNEPEDLDSFMRGARHIAKKLT